MLEAFTPMSSAPTYRGALGLAGGTGEGWMGRFMGPWNQGAVGLSCAVLLLSG